MSTLQVLLGFFYGSKRSVDSYYSLWLPQHVVLELIPHQVRRTTMTALPDSQSGGNSNMA